MKAGHTILSTLKLRYIRIRILEAVLLAVAIGLSVYCILYILQATPVTRVTAAVIVAVAIFLIRFFQLGLQRISESAIARFLDQRYPQLKASTDLLLAEQQTLPPLAQLQQIQTRTALESAQKKIHFPNHALTFGLAALATVAITAVVQLNNVTFHTSSDPGPTNGSSSQQNVITENLPAELKQVKIVVEPPAYTKIPAFTPADLNLTVQENSRVTWSLNFSDAVTNVSLVSSSTDTLRFKPDKNGEWQLSATLDRNGFYQLAWKDQTKRSSDYYKIDVVKDQPPVIRLTNLDQFTQVAYHSKLTVEAKPALSDDYGLTDAYIIATVSKGSGESVKFREEKIRFANEGQIRGKQLNVNQLLDLRKLGMEPGDELYFYVEAIDNKIPAGNRTRTETYFVSIPDTAQDVMTADGGLGVDLMPEYFRSQRQIIIDTEKLIRERKAITKKEFGSRSNELGYDQKVLRLRYGQFLGEEAESGIGHVETHADDEDEEHDESKKAADMVKDFGHQHDTENEHNLVEEKDPTKRDVDGAKKENLLEGFVHEHDNEESATFFYQSLKMKLKAALAQMWDAELYLRLYEPEKSLPYQYTALKLLKEISNDSRIYVHRTGFEPPPIKEEKRLTADLAEVLTSTQQYEAIVRAWFPNTLAAVQVVENLLSRPGNKLSPAEKNILLQSGSELAQAALENPALLQGLSALKTITSSDTASAHDLANLRKAYWLALPKRPATANKSGSSLHALDNKLMQNLLREQ